MVALRNERTVLSGQPGQSRPVRLAVREYGDPAVGNTPHVVFVHGYPDNQSLWDEVLAHLDGVHAITYDVRGAGASDSPPRLRDYRVERLIDDLVAVVEATVPAGARFHLVGHDWGSIQSWDAVTDPRIAGRVASFVSASGPSVDHVAVTFRRRPPRGLVRQLASSFYIFGYQLPWLPEQLWRSEHRLTPAILARLAAEGRVSEWTEQLAHDGASHVRLYRANMLRKVLRPRPPRVETPVLLVVATRDRLVGPAYLAAIEPHCADLRAVEIDAPHWHPISDPHLLAQALTDHLAGTKAT